MSDLAELRDMIEAILVDNSNAVWTTGTIDSAIRLALYEYNHAVPRHTDTTITLAADGREIDYSAVQAMANIQTIERVWLPYTSSDPEHPPESRAFEHWRNEQKLFITRGSQPLSSEVARIFFTVRHTIESLDGAQDTTVLAEDEQLIVLGACGFAAVSREIDVREQVTIDRDVGEEIGKWGNARLVEFRAGLERLRVRDGLSGMMVPNLVMDRYDGEWS